MSYNKSMNNLPAVSPDSGLTGLRSQESLQTEALRGLQAEIPLNDFGLPIGIYRTDLLPFHDYLPAYAQPVAETAQDPESRSTNDEDEDEDETNKLGTPEESEDILDGSQNRSSSVAPQVRPLTAPQAEYRIAGFPADALSKAFVPLQYDEGFPAFDNGTPFWCRLDFEPIDAFQAFQRYLEMNLGVPADPEVDDDFGRAASGARSISQLAATLHPNSDIIKMADAYQGFYHLYYWGSRAHAYDLFRVAQYRKQQELRAVETQDEHYIVSRRLRAKLMTYFDSEEDFWDMLTPKVGIEFLKQLTGMERVSAGIPAMGPQTAEQAAGAGTSLEVHLKTIAQTNRGLNDGRTIDEDGEMLDNALADPDTTELLQSIIIKSGGQ